MVLGIVCRNVGTGDSTRGVAVELLSDASAGNGDCKNCWVNRGLNNNEQPLNQPQSQGVIRQLLGTTGLTVGLSSRDTGLLEIWLAQVPTNRLAQRLTGW